MQDQQTPEHIRESDKRQLGGLILNALGIGDSDDTDTADEPCACDAEPDAEDSCSCESEPRTNTEATDDSEPDEPESETETTDDETATEPSMSDDYSERVETLASETPFSADELDAMSDEQIDAIDTTDASEPEPETTTTADADDEPTAADVDDETVEELKANYEALESEVSSLREELTAERKSDDIRVVTNALDIDEETAAKMDDEVLSELADEHRGDDGPRVNYGGRPGQVDRQPSEPDSEVDDYPAAGRTAYEQRNNSGD